MNLVIEGATSPLPLDETQVYPGSPASEALAWTTLFAGTMGPQQTTLIDLPDGVVNNAPQPGAILLRYTSNVNGVEQRAMYHLAVAGQPISTESTTWGSIKALYRD
jgi:hypothetical protein